jgi:hypothetical protein
MKSLGVLSFVSCIVFLAVVPLGNIYNVDRVYLQSLSVLGLFFALGIDKLARKIHVPVYAIALPVVLIYGGLMKYYCLRYAIVENY